MKSSLVLHAFLFAVVVLALPVHAQTTANDFITPVTVSQLSLSTKAQETLARVQKNPIYQQIQLVRLGNLAKIQQNGQLTFSLPGNPKPLIATASRVVAQSESTYDWYGELLNGVGHANFLCREGKITANISIGDLVYEIYHLDNDIHVLLNAFLDPKKSDCGNTRSFGSLPKTTPKGARTSYVGECVGLVRVLVLYTPDARNSVADINQTINMCISNFNSCVYNSNVTSRVLIELAGQAEINFQETNDISDDVETNLPNNATAQQLRNDTQADLVVLLTNADYGSVFGAAGTLDLDPTRAYAILLAAAAVSNRQTFSHEVGHLYSLRHNGDNNSSSQYQQYAHGYKFSTGLFQNCATIMVNGNDVPNSGRLLRFSNPNVAVDGVATGTADNNDNARRITETFATVNSFRSDVFRPLNVSISGPTYGYSLQWYT